MNRYTVTVKVDVFAENSTDARVSGLESIYEMMNEDQTNLVPFQIETEVEENFVEKEILINKKSYIWDKDEISYDDVIELSQGKPNDYYTMTYVHGHNDKSGILIKNKSAKTANKMRFNYVMTDNA